MSQNHGRDHSPETSTRPGLRMGMPALRPVSIVMVESGSCWPDGFQRPSAGSDCLVIAQQLDEAPSTFAERVVHRLRGLRAAGSLASRVTFAAGRDCNSERRRSRSMVARALFESSILVPTGSIDFVAHEGLDEDARHELLAFAGTLLEQVGYDPPAINVKFAGAEAPISGVRQTVPRPDGDTLVHVA